MLKKKLQYAFLSLGGAFLTLALKGIAWWLTDSVGLLSDALEAFVNVGSGFFALFILFIAHKPPDSNHPHGHDKAEYFFSGFEGSMIFITALGIAWASIERLLAPKPLESITLALGFSMAATLLNFGISKVLLRAAKKHRSVTLHANAEHLLTDVWTSLGVIVGMILVSITGYSVLDPLVALCIAIHILWVGYALVRSAIAGLMDEALPPAQQEVLHQLLQNTLVPKTAYHALRTRYTSHRCFISLHLLVPGNWTVQEGHELSETIERAIGNHLQNACVLIHLEPIDDPRSFADQELDYLHQ